MRAERRVRSPWETRGVGDPSHRRRIGRMLKEMGVAYVFQDPNPANDPVQPRVIIQHPRPDYLHVLTKADVLGILDFVGAEAAYGLKSIELSRQPAASTSGLPLFGQLIVPGRIMIYEQPSPPWRLPGVLSEPDAENMRQAGALVEIDDEVQATFVHWPGDSLSNFMIFEVLLHEIGHHILQHNMGKRTQRIARTRDHEAFARRFTDRCRAAWFDEEPRD